MTTTRTVEPLQAIDVLSQTIEPTLPPAPLQATASAVTTLDPKTMTDELLLDYRGAVGEQIQDLYSVQHAIDLEIERRMRERNARTIAHPAFEKVELVEQVTYEYTNDALLEAAEILKSLGKDEEARKLIAFVPERTTVIPAHYEAGKTVSILALAERYGNTPGIGSALARAIVRKPLGSKLVIKPKAVR